MQNQPGRHIVAGDGRNTTRHSIVQCNNRNVNTVHVISITGTLEISGVYGDLLCDVEVWHGPADGLAKHHTQSIQGICGRRSSQRPQDNTDDLRSAVSCGYGSKVGDQRAYQSGSVLH